jgi:hypothetical protein
MGLGNRKQYVGRIQQAAENSKWWSMELIDENLFLFWNQRKIKCGHWHMKRNIAVWAMHNKIRLCNHQVSPHITKYAEYTKSNSYPSVCGLPTNADLKCTAGVYLKSIKTTYLSNILFKVQIIRLNQLNSVIH